MTTLDLAAELAAYRERHDELAAELDAHRPAPDAARVSAHRKARARSAELDAAARAHYAEALEALRAGKDPGVPLAPTPYMRSYGVIRASGEPRPPEPVARDPLVPERVDYWRHVRDVEGPAALALAESALANLDREYFAALGQASAEHRERIPKRSIAYGDPYGLGAFAAARERWRGSWEAASLAPAEALQRIEAAQAELEKLEAKRIAGEIETRTGERVSRDDAGVRAMVAVSPAIA